jgi:membrane protein implicated in regulation of membrane protease activity
MRIGHWLLAAGVALVGAAVAVERYFFLWVGLAALVVGSLLPGGREDDAGSLGGGGDGDGGGD